MTKQGKSAWGRFIFAMQMKELNSRPQKTLFVFWNACALILSSAALCAVSLSFAIGRFENLFYIYLGYLRTPEIFLLNWLPLLLLDIMLYSLTNIHWVSFLITGIIGMLMSIGNYFKLIFRSDPFTFNDLTSIRAGLAVAGDYEIRADWRILLAILFLIVATVILFFFARARMNKKIRLLLFFSVALSLWPLWTKIYSDGNRYYDNSYKNFLFVTRDTRDSFLANGFYYPFLYSITESSAVPPDGYDEGTALEAYSHYRTEPVPEEKTVNIMVLQLESFADLEQAGVDGIANEVYEVLRELQAESFSGTMIADVIGGGTVITERSVLTGSYREQSFYRPAYSYVRFFDKQGYFCRASHPNISSFYTRGTINEYLGFERGDYLDPYFQEITGGEWRCDNEYLPEVFRLFRQGAKEDTPVFSFNVSLQGHSPYNSESFDRENWLWTGEGVSAKTRHVLNNYFSTIMETQIILMQELQQVKDADEPMVFLIYGDHKPLFDDTVYEELGLRNTMESEQSMSNYLGTPYLIWANRAAKEKLENDVNGIGPTVSPCYLMNLLFEQLGWKGPAFLQFTNDVMETLPVICTRGGYVEKGSYANSLSEAGRQLLNLYRDLIYYLHYRPELA